MKLIADFYLPFKLPVKEGLKQCSKYGFGEIITEYLEISEGVDIHFNNVPANRTNMRLTYFPMNGMENADVKEEVDSILRAFIHNSMYHINKVIDGIKITFGVQNIERITIRDLPTVIIVEIDETHYACMTNPDIVYDNVLVNSAADFAKVGATMTSMDMYPEVYLVENFLESAKASLHYERFTNFIVDVYDILKVP